MKSISAISVTVLMLATGYARAQNVEGQPYEDTGGVQAVQPPTAAPQQLPPAPPEQLPPPPQAPVQAAPDAYGQAQGVPQAAQAEEAQAGQWVYTAQYGWVWMPYGSQYTYTPTQTGVYPSEYVYYPSYGWTWLTAPWVFGWGVRPYFGVYGPSHFGWYGHVAAGGWRGYGYGGAYGRGYGNGYRGAYGGGYRPGYAAGRPAYGYGGAGMHVYRGAPSYGGGHVGAFGGGGSFHGGYSGGGHVGGFGGGGHSFGGGGHSFGGGGHSFGGGHGGRHSRNRAPRGCSPLAPPPSCPFSPSARRRLG